MSTVTEILAQTQHRPWDLPTIPWLYYQEWNEVLFMHWEMDPEVLKELIPENLELDLYNHKAWVSLVPFTMEKIRPSFLPYFAPISNFHEINLRTYVTKNGKSGVYFINIGSQKWLSTLLAKKLSGLPYENALIKREFDGAKQKYTSLNKTKGYDFSAHFKTSPRTDPKSPLEIWLTERYCLYVDQGENLYCYDIHHTVWELEQVEIDPHRFQLNYQVESLKLVTYPDHINYSKGIKVVAWAKELV